VPRTCTGPEGGGGRWQGVRSWKTFGGKEGNNKCEWVAKVKEWRGNII